MQQIDESLNPETLREELTKMRQSFDDRCKQIEESYKQSHNITLSNVDSVYGNYSFYSYATHSKQPMTPQQVNYYLEVSLEINKEKNFYLQKENKMYAAHAHNLFQAYIHKNDQYKRLQTKFREQKGNNPETTAKLKQVEKENQQIKLQLADLTEQNHELTAKTKQTEEKLSQLLFNITYTIRKNIQQASSVIINQDQISKGSLQSQARKLDRNVKKLLKVQSQIASNFKNGQQNIESLSKQLKIEQANALNLQSALEKASCLELKLQKDLAQVTKERDQIRKEHTDMLQMHRAQEDSDIWEQSQVKALNNLHDIMRSKKNNLHNNQGQQ